jgi:hypothetical protein
VALLPVPVEETTIPANANSPEMSQWREYLKNRQAFPLDELRKYRGRYIAFSLDGLRILASGATMEEVEEHLLAAGIAPDRVVGSYIPADGESYLG